MAQERQDIIQNRNEHRLAYLRSQEGQRVFWQVDAAKGSGRLTLVEDDGMCTIVDPDSGLLTAYLPASAIGNARINGCPVIFAAGNYRVIEHPAGFMLYNSWRVATLKTRSGAIQSAQRRAALDKEEGWL